MNTQLPDTACVAASWQYGSQLNVLGGVKTIIDQDHYIQHWIHLFFRHVFCAPSNTEALEFLKTHQATHLMLRTQDLFQAAKTYSAVGSDAHGDREFECIPLQMNTYENGTPFFVPVDTELPLTHIDFGTREENETLITATAKMKTGETVEIPYTVFVGKQTRLLPQKSIPPENGGILLIFNAQKQFHSGYYIPQVGWNSLAVRLYFRGDLPDIFVPVYPVGENASVSEFKIYEIHYPPDIQSDPKYLKTGFPEMDETLQLR